MSYFSGSFSEVILSHFASVEKKQPMSLLPGHQMQMRRMNPLLLVFFFQDT